MVFSSTFLLQYVQTLEQQLHESCADNDKLLEENMQLKLRNAQLQQEVGE